MQRRDLLTTAALAALAGPLAGARPTPARAADPPPPTTPAPGPFDGATVRRLAQVLARQSWQEPDSRLPAAIDKLEFDQWRGIRFKPDRALWRGQNLPFQVQFFPRGFLYRPAVEVFEVADGQATRVAYNADLFDYDDPKLKLPDALGFSGLRIMAPINRPDSFEEFCVFLGASYFRAVAKGQVYGLSARGLAIATGNPRGEEFARFRAFWLERPQPGVNSVVLHALLDTASTTGAYRFTIHPGDETVFDVETALYPRIDITEPGIATLTSMFLFDANDRHRFDDWRPAAHDSEGLEMWTGRDERLWRPLADPADLQISSFGDTNPHGFGLMQRKRAFTDYQDLSLQYGKRPSLWIEPIGDWGQGVVALVEIPSPSEVNDNMVAFWRPKDKLNAHGEYNFTYRMHWGWDFSAGVKLARFVNTMIGLTVDQKSRLFVLDLAGDALKSLPPDAKLRADIGSSQGRVQNIVVQPNPETAGWRITFELTPADLKLAELHCTLAGEKAPLSETWLYRWTP